MQSRAVDARHVVRLTVGSPAWRLESPNSSDCQVNRTVTNQQSPSDDQSLVGRDRLLTVRMEG